MPLDLTFHTTYSCLQWQVIVVYYHPNSFFCIFQQVKIVRVLLNDYSNCVCSEDLAIMTPYTAQKELIKRELSNVNMQVKVQTITESQGT